MEECYIYISYRMIFFAVKQSYFGGGFMRYLLKNGTVVSGEKSEQMDILIEGEKIAAVGHNLQAEDAKVIEIGRAHV